MKPRDFKVSHYKRVSPALCSIHHGHSDGFTVVRINWEHCVSQSRAGRIDSSDPLAGDRNGPPNQRPAFSSYCHDAILVAGESFADDGTSSGGGVRRDPLAETEGRPVCPRCCPSCYDGRRPNGAPRWRCKTCQADFSLTSGTLFAFRKLPIRTYLAAIVIFVNEIKGKSALALSRDLEVPYKTRLRHGSQDP
jgi:hypothetical protein